MAPLRARDAPANAVTPIGASSCILQMKSNESRAGHWPKGQHANGKRLGCVVGSNRVYASLSHGRSIGLGQALGLCPSPLPGAARLAVDSDSRDWGEAHEEIAWDCRHGHSGCLLGGKSEEA